MAGIVTRPVFPFSGRNQGALSTISLSSVRYDYALGGLPFLSAINAQRPMTRGGVQVRKEQFDNQQIPGEQSLADWWLRSQSTFIGGAGLLYQDPSVDNQYAIRFAHSVGVNPWVNGQLTLLRKTSQRIADASSSPHLVMGFNDGVDRYYSAVGAALKSDTGTATTTISWGGAGTILALAGDGTNYYAADSVGIYKGVGSGAGALAWSTGSPSVAMGWVKGRLMAGIGSKVYELLTGGPALPPEKFAHLNPAWKWTAFTEGPDSIYASGYAGSTSSIYRFVLDNSGSVPTLAAGGVITAQLPQGEIVHTMNCYLGSFIGIGTNRGFRVGQIGDNGDIAYGPLLIENPNGVKAVAAYDRFFFVGATNGIDGNSGLYRVDLGQPLQESGISPSVRFAYATDLQAKVTGEVSGASNFGNSDRIVFSVIGRGSYLEDATTKELAGTLTTGRIRYNTLEPKLFKFVSVRTPVAQAGAISVSVGEPGGGLTPIITAAEGSNIPLDNVALRVPEIAAEWIYLTFTLNRSAANPAAGAQMDGWQLKAMPGTIRQRLLTVPLLLQDREKDIYGQMVGYEGRTRTRLAAFEALFQRGDVISFQELASDLSTQVVIDNYRFEQATTPGRHEQDLGGVLWVELRTIADVST